MVAVSVVIPNWNGELMLPACLDSVRAQTLCDHEVIVADDASTDGSAELLSSRYPEVKVIRLSRNRGFAATANAGIRAGVGEFVFLLNNDAELDPRCLEEAVAAIRSDDSLGSCATKMVYCEDPSLVNSAGHACGADGIVVDIGRGERDGPAFAQPREVLGACAGAALYRRRMLDQVGLFDEDFVMSFEDADLSWRAQWAGWRCRYVPTAIARHREGASRGIASKRSVEYGLRNAALVWMKNWPCRSLVGHFGDIWRCLRRSMASLMFRGYGGVLPRVVWGVVARLPAILSRRLSIRRGRAVPAGRFEELLSPPSPEAVLTPFDSGIRLGMVRLTQQALAGLLSLVMLLLVLGAATMTDLAAGRTREVGKTR
ncbi:MAG: glycosyltransferase family 2 protein [Armatimonadota bacterium]